MTRVLPDMAKAKAHWIYRGSEIPDYLMVPMSNGQVVRYNPEIEQPGVTKALENIRRMQDAIALGGYKYKPQEEEEHE